MGNSDWWGIVRHLLTALGGALVTNGVLTGGQVQDGIGAISILVGIGCSLYNKYNQREAVHAAHNTGVGIGRQIAAIQEK